MTLEQAQMIVIQYQTHMRQGLTVLRTSTVDAAYAMLAKCNRKVA